MPEKGLKLQSAGVGRGPTTGGAYKALACKKLQISGRESEVAIGFNKTRKSEESDRTARKNMNR